MKTYQKGWGNILIKYLISCLFYFIISYEIWQLKCATNRIYKRNNLNIGKIRTKNKSNRYCQNENILVKMSLRYLSDYVRMFTIYDELDDRGSQQREDIVPSK